MCLLHCSHVCSLLLPRFFRYMAFAYCQWAGLGLVLLMAVGGSSSWEKEPEALSWVRIPARRHVGTHRACCAPNEHLLPHEGSMMIQ